MTRILSELLQATGPHFRMQLNQLERVSGHRNTDIKLTVEVVQAAKQKIRQLGLDQHDTTGRELYHTLLQRIDADDKRLERALRTRAATYVSAEADLLAGLQYALQDQVAGMKGMGLKTSALKKMLKALPPKRVQRLLGYRSLDAMLRHESTVQLVAVARQLETATWRRSWLESYKKLSPASFEERNLQVFTADDERWTEVARVVAEQQAHTVIALPEAGAILLLPMPEDHPSGMVIAATALALHELNTVSAAGTYIRSAQVHGDFGQKIYQVASGRIDLEAPHMPQAMPWQLVQRYFATTKSLINEDIFGPYVDSSDFSWHDVEAKLSELCPSLAFWHDTAHLTYLHDGQPISLNVVDAAINACNRLSYEARSVYHAQQSLWNELTLRYLNHASVEQAVASVLHPQLALETAEAE